MAQNAYRTQALYAGTSALKVERENAPRLTLIEGGLGKAEKSRPTGKPAVEPVVRAVSSYDEAPAVMLRVLTRGQLVVFGVVATVLLVVGLTVSTLFANASARAAQDAISAAPSCEVSVMSGDTLWGIAEEHGVEGASTSDVVRWIQEANDLEGASLSVGQSLVVPA